MVCNHKWKLIKNKVVIPGQQTFTNLPPEKKKTPCKNKIYTYIVCQLKIFLTCQLVMHTFNKVQYLKQKIKKLKM